MRRFVSSISLVLVLTGCLGGGAETADPASSPVPSTTSATPSPTVEATDSSETPGPTSSPPPTAQTESAVGPGWSLAVYDASSDEGRADGPKSLLLVAPDGAVQTISTWEGDRWVDVLDWTPDGSSALLRVSARAHTTLVRIELATAAETVVAEADLDTWMDGRFTRPTGRNVVVSRSPFEEDKILERRDADGTLLATVYSRPYDTAPELRWLYNDDGRSLVVNGVTTLTIVSNDGTVLDEVAAPERTCDPVRWWQSGDLLVTCADAESNYYGRLWLVPLDDADQADPLTGPRPADAPVVDLGYVDALPTDDVTFLQWIGDCGAAAVHRLVSDDGTARIDRTNLTENATFLLASVAGRLYVRTSGGCDTGGELVSMTHDGSDRRVLVKQQPGHGGVTSAITLPDPP